MRKYFTHLIVFFALQDVFAQQAWWPVHPGQINYYKLDTGLNRISNNQIFSLFITDSIEVDASKKYIFNKYLLKNTDDNNFLCQYGINSNPLGRYLEVNDTDFILQSDFGMSIKLNKNQVTGDTTFLFSTNDTNVNYFMVCVGQDFGEVFGEKDSIRRYCVHSVPQKDHYDSLILSKHYGLLKTPQIRLFDDISTDNTTENYDWDISGTLILVGNNAHVNNPVPTINFKDLYDYSENDIMQIEETKIQTYGQLLSIVDSTIVNKKVMLMNVLSKETKTDSTLYLIKNSTYNTYEFKSRIDWRFWDTVSIDTQRLTIAQAPNILDNPPGTIFNGYANTKATIAYTFKYNTDAVELISYNGLSGNDTCLGVLFHATPSNSLFYASKLGGPYYKEYSENSLTGNTLSFERKLTYYSNSSGIWGTPYPFPLGLKKNHDITSNWVKVYPNPAKDWIQVSATYPAHITIYDLQGIVVYQAKLSANENIQIPCGDWNAGLYFAKLTSENETKFKKFVVNHSR